MDSKRKCTTIVQAALLSFTLLILYPSEARAQGGESLYKTKCVACHGADGKGETAIGKANKLRDFASADVQKQSDDELSGVISAGKGKMPAYGKSLKAEQIKDLVTYIRTFKK
jgi:mono/diheme cytochrome c family protein